LGLAAVTSPSSSGITPSTPSKLAPQFYGPFYIVARISAVAYWLRLPENAKIHDVFHVGIPKKFVGTPLAEVAQLPLVVHGRVVPTPQHAIQACLNRGVWELLIHWQGSAPSCLLSSLLIWTFSLRTSCFSARGVMLPTPLSVRHTVEGSQQENRRARRLSIK